MPSLILDNPNNPAKPTKSPKVLIFILLWPSLPENRDELIQLSKHVPQDIEMEVQVQPSQGNLDPSILEDIRTFPKKLKNVASGSVLVSDEPKRSKLKSKLIKDIS